MPDPTAADGGDADSFALQIEKLANELFGDKARQGEITEADFERYVEVARRMGCCRPMIVNSPRPCCFILVPPELAGGDIGGDAGLPLLGGDGG